MSDKIPETRKAREAYAQSLSSYKKELGFYDRRASSFKAQAQWLDMLILAAGGLVAALPVLKAAGKPDGVDLAVTALGFLVVVLQGALRIHRPHEIWPEYRRAAERMKREERTYVHVSAPYDLADEEAARKLYLKRLETIIAEEQKSYFADLLNETDATCGTPANAPPPPDKTP